MRLLRGSGPEAGRLYFEPPSLVLERCCSFFDFEAISRLTHATTPAAQAATPAQFRVVPTETGHPRPSAQRPWRFVLLTSNCHSVTERTCNAQPVHERSLLLASEETRSPHAWTR